MCNAFKSLDLTYTQAWLDHNHDKVIELRKAIELHRRTCPECGDELALARGLWRGAEVVVTDGNPLSLA